MKPTELTDAQAERCFELAFGVNVAPGQLKFKRNPNSKVVIVISDHYDPNYEDILSIIDEGGGQFDIMASNFDLASRRAYAKAFNAAAVVDYLRSLVSRVTPPELEQLLDEARPRYSGAALELIREDYERGIAAGKSIAKQIAYLREVLGLNQIL